MSKFKVGDRVKLVKSTYIDQDFNPIWGGDFGHIPGKIIKAYRIDHKMRYEVTWENGKTNGMYFEDLLNILEILPKEMFEM